MHLYFFLNDSGNKTRLVLLNWKKWLGIDKSVRAGIGPNTFPKISQSMADTYRGHVNLI